MDDDRLAKLSADFPIVRQEDELFEEARAGRVFNHRRPSRQPLAVVKATSQEDVKEAVKLANSLNRRISIRSGGHSWAAWSVRENAILIDLEKFNSMSYDDETKIVSVGPATTGENLEAYLREKGRIVGGPHCPSVGVGGFL
jgi:FAD/FMN-containing dehydrogenase